MCYLNDPSPSVIHRFYNSVSDGSITQKQFHSLVTASFVPSDNQLENTTANYYVQSNENYIIEHYFFSMLANLIIFNFIY